MRRRSARGGELCASVPDRRGWRPRAVALLIAAALAGGLCRAATRATVDETRAQALTAEAREQYAASRYSQAAGKLQTALELAPGYTAAHQLLAIVEHAQRALDRALDHYWAVQRASLPELPDEAPEAQVRQRELIIACESMSVLMVNEERLQRKLPLCQPDVRLAAIARQHSEEMRDLRYFSHESPTAGLHTITDRFKREFRGVAAYCIAENIARRYGQGVSSLSVANLRRTHEEWMDSPGHRANILGADLDRIGVGLSANPSGDYWATQFFARF